VIRGARGGTYAALALLVLACAGPNDPTEHLQAPTRERFEFVSDMLGARCGSLDCHGQVGRSLRLYSRTGLRRDPAAFPDIDAAVPSDAEVEDNYRAAISLEPEVLALVVRDQGANPERLTLLRKARGAENHKGGAAIALGSPSDRCLLSWLSSQVEQTSCEAGALLIRPDAGSTP
jgi:hypothetical protein